MAEKFDSKLVTVSVEIYARLLTAYPPAFRRQFGAEMKQLFLDQSHDAAKNGNGARLLSGQGCYSIWLRHPSLSVWRPLMRVHGDGPPRWRWALCPCAASCAPRKMTQGQSHLSRRGW